jgi:glyoxylase-like metal-dependent hydrolase (beta-lactamase superfamily II)
MKPSRILLSAALVLVTTGAATAAVGFRAATHPSEPATLGAPATRFEEILDEPGPLAVETIDGASWSVPLSGLLDLEHPKARAAGLEDRLEPIRVVAHALRHPERGLYLVDTGVGASLGDTLGPIVSKAMGMERLHVRTTTGAWLERSVAPLAGVLLTHLHVDHISGLRDIPDHVPVYAGPGEVEARDALHVFVQGPTDRLLEGKAPVRTFRFEHDPDGRFAGVLDLLGDGSLFALWMPGHTPGSTAYVARTKDGPVLFTGDACHTRWGWDHGVAPGSFSHDREQGQRSLDTLRSFAARHPRMRVVVGHQE